MPESIRIALKYEGRDVDDGTMSISEVICALQGFSGAYGKIASAIDPGGQHQLRISDIKKSSFELVALAWINEHKDVLIKVAPVAVSAVAGVIIKIIEFKKNLKGKEPSLRINGDGNIVLMGEGNTTLTLPQALYEVYKSKGIDAELSKIAKPLEEGKIDRAEFSATDGAGYVEKAEILSSDKKYFQGEEVVAITSRPVRLIGYLVSLNKESNLGTFRMQNGKLIKFHYSGSDPESMYRDFAYNGAVRVECVAAFGDDLEVRSIEITTTSQLQYPIPLESQKETSEPVV